MAVEFLCTVHGTLIYFDEANRCLRHATGGGVPANAGLMIEDGVGRLVYRSSNDWMPLNGQNHAGHVGDTGPHAAPLRFQVRRLPDGLVALSGNGVWLAADLEGVVSLNRQTQGPWEAFLPLDSADRTFLEDVASQGWITSGGDVVPARAGLGLQRDFIANIGTLRLKLTDLLAGRRWRHRRGWSVIYDKWKVEHFTPFRPLVYLIAMGKPEIFETLALALQSLWEFGQYDGEVLIFTDRPAAQVQPFIPTDLAPRVAIAHAPAQDVTDMMAIKYRICDMPDLARHRPLLYLDCDVICDRPIRELLLELARASRISVPLELPLLGGQGYYGDVLFQNDPAAMARNERGFSAGIIGIPDIEAAQQTFPVIRDAIYGFSSHLEDRSHIGQIFHDQGVANYVMHKMDAADFSILTPRVMTPTDFNQPVHEISRRGFAHFCGGVGDANKKLPAMRAYYEFLRTQKP